jgi:hypothetical protein
MQNFLVVSYDSDQQQFFYDSVSAESEGEATDFILQLRPYVQDADATVVNELAHMFDRVKDEPTYKAEHVAECQNCSIRTPESQLNEIKDYSERVEPGESAPAGECPECGALAQRV